MKTRFFLLSIVTTLIAVVSAEDSLSTPEQAIKEEKKIKISELPINAKLQIQEYQEKIKDAKANERKANKLIAKNLEKIKRGEAIRDEAIAERMRYQAIYDSLISEKTKSSTDSN